METVFDLPGLQRNIDGLQEKLNDPAVWSDPKKAGEMGARLSRSKETLGIFQSFSSEIRDLDELIELAEDEGDGMLGELTRAVDDLEQRYDAFEFQMTLSGPHDGSNCYLEVNSGAGGTEACDWAMMLTRMYTRYIEEKGWKCTEMDVQPGDEAGVKSVMLYVEGEHAYGYLKNETGVHRLVRISPFDANKRRHTSFASVLASPEIDDDIVIDIRDEDLRVDTYRASGAGGQHVNKTSSAIRLTHIPTGTVVTCQNERSQHKNRAQAMKVLQSRLYERELRMRQDEKAKLNGEKKAIAWGSQIRSYVFQPYQMVKDLRTGHQTGNIQGVMDGALEDFIIANLRSDIRGEPAEVEDLD